MSTHIYTREECKKLIGELEVIKRHETRSNVKLNNITPKLMESILYYTIKCRDSISERIYWVLNDIEDYSICPHCSNIFKPRFYGLKNNYDNVVFCSNKCLGLSTITIEKKKKTCLKNHGVEYPSQSPLVQEKIEQTSLKNWGYSHPSQSPEVQAKIEQTSLLNWGYKNPTQSPLVREKMQATCEERLGVKFPGQSLEVQAKMQTTCKQNHGVENPSQSLVIQEKKRQNSLLNWGYNNPAQSPEVQAKMRATCEERYGYKNVWSSPIIRKQIEQTCLERYDVTHHMHNIDIFLKCQKNTNTFKLKILVLPSGGEVTYQGYEDVTILTLLDSGYSEEQIVTDNKLIPSFKYTFEDKDRIYYPDIYIPHENLIIEVKSTYTYSKELSKNEVKKQACLDAGYRFEFWICSDKEVMDIL